MDSEGKQTKAIPVPALGSYLIKRKCPAKKRISRKNIDSQNDPMPCLCYFISFPHCFLIHYFIFRYRELVF